MLIMGKCKKDKNGRYRIYQSCKNTGKELLHLLNITDHNNSAMETEEQIWINTGHYWDKDQLLSDILNNGIKKTELLNILKKNMDDNKSFYKFYTDGSLVKREKIKKMGIGWLLKDTVNNGPNVEFKAANIGWPSSTKAEILAILTALIVVI